jgi:hypothetical protein
MVGNHAVGNDDGCIAQMQARNRAGGAAYGHHLKFGGCSPASQNVPDEMGKEKRQQQTSDTTNPEEKMLGQLWGIDLFLVHE